MSLRIALAGNPNSGKTTLFNGLTGANQFVGNWPGVTVEKKEGKLKKHSDVTIADLPGIYSLSPYTLEEVVARNYLIQERPDAILNIVDGTNLERNLYLTTQLTELGIPVVVAVNMMDLVRKRGDKINIKELSRQLGCPVLEISALKGTGIQEAAEAAIQAARAGKTIPQHTFSGPVEHAIAHIEEAVLHDQPEEQQRWYAIKIFERDAKVLEQLNIPADKMAHIERDIQAAEEELDDDAESIITNERYLYISGIMGGVQTRKATHKLNTSDRIDRVVTNRFLALPIFVVIMFLVYWVSMGPFGSMLTDWANDGVFGDGWHLLGIGTSAYEADSEPYTNASNLVNGYIEDQGLEDVAQALDSEQENFDAAAAVTALEAMAAQVDTGYEFTYGVEDQETLAVTEETASGGDVIDAVTVLAAYDCQAPDPADYGIWVPGIPVLVQNGLTAIGCADWLSGLVLDGIIGGVGAVLGFVPQMLVLFLFLGFLETCGYMARIAFILDRIFRKFGLSGKSFIPFLVGMGCGVPGIMASRTIENEKDRRMTIMTTTFIPCGAKQPFIAMMAGAIFGGSPYIAVAAYFMGIAAIICSGILLKKTRLFAGDPAPFVMELPGYHMPTVGTLFHSMWERGWSFIRKAGTIILLSTIVIWFLSFFGFVEGAFTLLSEDQLDHSILATLGGAISWIFAPLGFGNWQATVASITGLVAKENIVGTMGILFGSGGANVYAAMGASFTALSGFAFLAFNLLCAPCFAAMGAIKREMNSVKWFWVAIGYQCGFAYLVGLCIYQLGMLFTGHFGLGSIVAILIVVAFLYLLLRPTERKKAAAGQVAAGV